MTPEQLFSILNAIAAVAWIVLAVAPRRRWANLIVPTVVPLALAVVYVAIVAAVWTRSEGGFSSLADVATLFQNPWMLLAGWTHYLAFDLLVGGWEARDAAERGIPHIALLPCLVLTFLFGPAGWLFYLGVRSLVTRARAPERVA
jgi:hypothetical protein